jgi:serine/threonine-protein kinase
MDASRFKHEVLALLETQDWDEADDIGLSATLKPDHSTVEPEVEVALESLPTIGPEGEQIEVRQLLGKGGMGMVHLAHQHSIGRDIAVKRLKPDQRCGRNLRRLLTEARLTGSLEHPNIIPVYLLGRDGEGNVFFAMKRIEGTPWRRFFDHPELAEQRADSGEALDFHLDVLMQVCNAVHFAHSRGVIHRDIKPENVMVGDFGEVYLLDWGIAIERDADAGDPLVASPGRGLAGTPTLMAPEMVSGDPALIDERSDVYLLGAVLHKILTGQPRHPGESLPEVLVAAKRSPPVEYDDSVPEELAAIANRATRPDPADRFESAEAFRRAIGESLRHRGSERLRREASRRLAELSSQMEAGGGPAEAQAPATQRLFTECRFGFQQALAEWPDNQRAREGLQLTLELMIEVEIAQRSPAAAAALLSELPEANADLEARVSALRRSLSEEQAEFEHLRRIRRAIDVGLGTRTRSLLCLLLALLWGVPDTVIGVLDATGVWHPSYAFLSLRSVLFAAVLGVAALAKRETLLGNVANRRIIGSGLILFASQLMIWLVAWRTGIPLEPAAATTSASFAVITAVMAITIDLRVWLAAGCLLGGAISGAIWPPYAMASLGLSAILGLVALAWVWRE